VNTATGRVTQNAFTASATFAAIGTHHQLVVTRPEALGEAIVIARRHLCDLDLAASRFRADSEVSALARLAADRDAASLVSAVLTDNLQAALRVAALTEGLVDPTVGGALIASGYDADLDEVRARATSPAAPAPVASATPAPVPGWRSIRLDVGTQCVHVPRGTVIDLGASAKAHAADTIATALAQRLPGGFLVNLGGDIAVSGELPPDGWQIGVEGTDGEVRQVVTSRGQAFATSSTGRRTWTQAGESHHHIVDPRTGRTAAVVWEQVTCAATNALEANAASTAAVVLGAEAHAWLEAHGIPARLDPAGGGPVVTTTGWPEPVGTHRSAA
jgi:thiamine biosynthesis lipoprotein